MSFYTKVIMVFFLLFQSIIYGQTPEVKELIETLNYKKDIVYKVVDGISLEMDIYYPNADKIKKNNPWMLHVHGGGWRGGDRYKVFRKSFVGTLKSLLEEGVVCVTIEYRRTRGKSTAYDAVVDAKDAAKFLLKNAEKYKLDTKEYGIWGGSAGGHLSLVTALSKNSDFKGDIETAKFSLNFKCVVSYFPATSLLNPELVPGSLFEKQDSYDRILGDSLKNKPKLAKLLSPTELLKKNSPPILLLHGDKDIVLPLINSTYMVEVAKKKKANVELLVIKNAGHSFSGSNISPSMEDLNQYATNFILSHLKK
ncbi:prolyl oligopeptidase family serine peptidase [Polaribacter sargassicola]|uniref:prolyl oligopeptidase family serine peptidase n=1 Tax=Polaribacter sargassicola TaxID=2836891 RepID=UPI001F021763|nr:prolyl oligopeptidase family serine peptidase [Polaribacter sp. DS7-9]MCG1037432.1 prolyl oligopeptidase family serine peptidase [Polaribacter sp. DS7-9]